MEIFQNHLLDWLILLGLLGLTLYVMKSVGEERSSFKEDSYEVRFGKLSLTIPNWWTITDQEESRLKFERTDTRYDWFATFAYFAEPTTLPLDKLLENKLNKEEIEFDIDVVFETDSRVIFRDSEIQEHFQEVIRVEGKASQSVTERIYYDIYIMRGLNDQGYFIFESRSSVLNGLVEGPYFEESLAYLSFIHES